MPDLSLENNIPGVVAGIDEAGRGPWAGPVVAAAVVLNRDDIPSGINDSKKLSKKNRENLFVEIKERALVGVGIIDVETIDRTNILKATMQAMTKAINNLTGTPDFALVDGNQMPELFCKGKTIIKGDAKSFSIAAASIIAKVTRDKIMQELHNDFPLYGWNNNSGYGTKEHSDALLKYGITSHHRKSFAPIRKLIDKDRLYYG